MALPTKLKHDAITQAVFQIRFEPHDQVPEIVLGRLADAAFWEGFSATRLPLADMPHGFRMMDQVLRNQPLIELKRANDGTKIKIGSNSIACHMFKPYQGWDAFHAFQVKAADALYAAVPDAKIERLGLRYMNTLEAAVHHVESISELQLRVKVGSDELTDNYNLNFKMQDAPDMEHVVKVATKAFTSPPLKGDGHTLIDIDVRTPADCEIAGAENIKEWLPRARNAKNSAFFNLFSDRQIEQMRDS